MQLKQRKREVPNAKFSIFTVACEASGGAGIIISATTSPTPIVSRKWDDEVSMANPGNCEFEYNVFRAAGKIVTDDRQEVFHGGVHALARMRLDGLLSGEDIYVNIGENSIRNERGGNLMTRFSFITLSECVWKILSQQRKSTSGQSSLKKNSLESMD